MSKIQIRKDVITTSVAGKTLFEFHYWNVQTPEGVASFDTHTEAIDWADYFVREARK